MIQVITIKSTITPLKKLVVENTMSLYIKIIIIVLSATSVISDILNVSLPHSTESKVHIIRFLDVQQQVTNETRQGYPKFENFDNGMEEGRMLSKNQDEESESLSLSNFKNNTFGSNITDPIQERFDVLYDYSDVQLETENSSWENNCNFMDEEANEKIVIRKCCQVNEFFSYSASKCVTIEKTEIFHDHIRKFTNASLLILSKLLDEECGDRLTALMDKNSHFTFVGDGKLKDCFLGHVYNQTEYCLELVGNSVENSELVLTYCPKRIVIPKCCGFGYYYYDSKVPDCVSYVSLTEEVEEASLLPDTINYELGFSDLQCKDQMVWLDLEETYFNGTALCLNEKELCLDFDKYCIDNRLQNVTTKLVKSALVCPEFIINKCCLEGESFIEQECVKIDHRSPYLNYVLNSFKFKVKRIFNQTNDCNVVTITNDTLSEISWSIDSEGKAVLTYENNSIFVNNFCIEDFFSGEEIIPGLKICSEEISSLRNWFENLLGKCCPSHMVFNHDVEEVRQSCVPEQGNVRRLIETEELKRLNVKNLQIAGFPSCLDSHYHYFNLGKSTTDYAELTENGSLNIVGIDNGCKVRETKIASNLFCLEYKVEGRQYKPHAFVCAPDPKNPHSEKTALIVTLVGISCAALTASFISLFFMTVPRGTLNKERKVNTLAGKILLSYVASQLIGYLTIGIISLVDSGGDPMMCLILTGLLIFFMLAAFCWNSSICLECLLITVHVRTSDNLRFLLHSIWAWGIPGVVTAITLIRNSNENKLSCDSIKPQIGKDRCFFSDTKAILLFFYLPISITVIVNGVLLATSKIIRKTTIKKLGKDQCSIGRHENVKKVFSLQNMKAKKRVKRERYINYSTRSGLRTHQNKSVYIEALKLVTWSGITWLMEILGTLATLYGGRSHGEWYNYLWYIPVGCNCLRGLGISFIISFSSEAQTKVSRTLGSISSDFGESWSELKSKTIRGNKSHYFKQNALSVVEKFRFIGSLYVRDIKSTSAISNSNPYSNDQLFNGETRNGPFKDNDNQDEVASMSIVLTNISNTTPTFHETPPSKTTNFYHSVSRSDPVIISNLLSDILETLDYSMPIQEEAYLTNDLDSLDNSLMELTFWDEVSMKKSLEYKNSLKTNNYRTMNRKEKYSKTPNATDRSHRSSGKFIKTLGSENSVISGIGNVKSLDGNESTENKHILNGPQYRTACNTDTQQACHKQECVCSFTCENTYL